MTAARERQSQAARAVVESARTGAVPLLALVCALPAMLALLGSDEGVPAAVTLLSLGGLGLATVALSASREEWRVVASVFCVALVLRGLAASFIYHWNPAFFSLDQGPYFRSGASLAAEWHAAGAMPSLDWLVGGAGNHFAEMWALLSYFVGPSQLALRFATGVVGAYTAVRIYVLARETFGEKAGRWAGWMAACWPSFIVWSAQGLRDPLLIWLWCEVGIGVVRLNRGRAGRGLVGIALAMYGLTLLRPYAAVLAGLGAALAFLVSATRGAKTAKLLGLVVVGTALLVAGLGFMGSDFLAEKDLETAVSIHRSFSRGGSAFAISADISTYGAAALYLPLGLAYFLLAPFPWQSGSALQMSTMLEQPTWYLVLVLAGIGCAAAWRRARSEGLSVLATGLPAVLFYSLVMSNVGTGYRDKAQVVPFVFAYAAHGLVLWRAERAARRRCLLGLQPRRGDVGSAPAVFKRQGGGHGA